MRASCEGCPERDSCQSICPDIERLLPAADAGTWAALNSIDKAVAWSVQDHEDIFTARRRLVARLYHRFGWTEAKIARLLGIRQRSVCDMLGWIRRKIEKSRRKTPLKIP